MITCPYCGCDLMSENEDSCWYCAGRDWIILVLEQIAKINYVR